jgi:putative endopeptidase
MKQFTCILNCILLTGSALVIAKPASAGDAPKVPRFSVDYMDKSVDPATDFYRYADGNWVKNNPVPSDKARWGGFSELAERNWFLLHEILESASTGDAKANSPARKVGDFYKSAMDTNKLEELGFKPLAPELAKIDKVSSTKALFKLLADLHDNNVGACFGDGVSPDSKNSTVYAFELGQGGLGLPDRDYYLTEAFAKKRALYEEHVTKMFTLLGEEPSEAKKHAATVLDVETALAKESKSRVALRDPNANYHKFTPDQLSKDYPNLPFDAYFVEAGVGTLPYLIVGQPEFFAGLDKMVKDRPLDDWKVYLRWHLIHSAAPYLHSAVEKENFAFYGTALSGQPSQEPRWQRSGKVIDRSIGEALGEIFVEKHFTPAARARMN